MTTSTLAKIFFTTSLMLLSLCCHTQSLSKQNSRLPCLEQNFNLLFHLTVDSTNRQPYFNETDIFNILEKTNEVFAPLCISFDACEFNIIENYTFHNLVDNNLRIEELGILYGKTKRLNIFILGKIPNQSCGFSEVYGINNIENTGGYIFLEAEDCEEELWQQLSHHLGHFFGLQDTHHGSDLEIVEDPECAIRGDSICDTPTDPFGLYIDSLGIYIDSLYEAINFEEFINGCEFIHTRQDPNGQYYCPQVGNIMSPYPCKCSLTKEQYLKVAQNYYKASFKPY